MVQAPAMESTQAVWLNVPLPAGRIEDTPGRVVVEESLNIAELEALLVSMRDESPDTHFVRVAECDRLRLPVAAPCRSGLRLSQVIPVPSPARGSCSLFVEPRYSQDPARGIKSVADGLWNEAAKPLLEGKFSFRAGEFHPFDDYDLQFILQALAVEEDDES